MTIEAMPAHHPTSRIGKTLLSIFARNSAPSSPVNGYFFEGYYHSGDTVYTPLIKEAMKGKSVHTACLPIGGKYNIATPEEALKIAEDISASCLVPMHWQPIVQEVPFRYQPSDLVKLGKQKKTKIAIRPLAIGQVLDGIGSDRPKPSLREVKKTD